MRNVLITGANRGLGLGFVKSFLAKNVNVICTTRNISGSKELLQYKKNYPKNLKILELDLLEEYSVSTLSDLLSDQPIDIFINNAGVGNSNQRFGVVSSKPWVEVLKVNLIAPLTVTQSIIENIEKGSDKKIYFLSSQLGSIKDNTSGGMYIYRSSKTALNQVVKSLSVDLKPMGITVISLHPGWVKTDMGGPNAPVSIDESIKGMMKVIDATDIRNTGTFLNFDGQGLPW
ncbi:SDR family oxidoreductase [Paracoccaceae bacterium]|nr:SDR family oxidoreductase [Paracoccaceae bacterium]